jgi:cysteine desulfurase
VLRACGIDEQTANSSIRFGIGRFNTEEEMDYAANAVTASVERLREQSPLYRQASKVQSHLG